MDVTINNKTVSLPSGTDTVRDLVEWKCLKENGTAIAVNDRLICHDCWDSQPLAEGDRIVVISAAFGG